MLGCGSRAALYCVYWSPERPGGPPGVKASCARGSPVGEAPPLMHTRYFRRAECPKQTKRDARVPGCKVGPNQPRWPPEFRLRMRRLLLHNTQALDRDVRAINPNDKRLSSFCLSRNSPVLSQQVAVPSPAPPSSEATLSALACMLLFRLRNLLTPSSVSHPSGSKPSL